LDRRAVVAREVAGDGAAQRLGVRAVGEPGLGRVAAVPGGEEVRRAALGHVEAERAAELAAEDGVAAADAGGERTTDRLDPRRTARAGQHGADLVELGAGDGT